MRIIRSLALFAAGIVFGTFMMQPSAAQQEGSKGLRLNHVGMYVKNFDESMNFYTKTMGFPEAFRVTNPAGQVQLVYVQISQNTFVELLPDNAQRPPGINHFGVHVDNMAAATAMFKQRGANVGEIINSGTKAILSNIIDPNGVRMELAELPPESLHRQAMQRWK